MKSKENKILRFFNLDNGFLLVCLAVFCVFLLQTLQMKHASGYLLPRLLCVSGIIFIGIMILSGQAKRGGRIAAAAEEKKGMHPGFAMLFAAGYFAATYFLGFILATGIAMIAFSYLMKYRNKVLAFVLAVAIPFALHFAFVTFLQATLPRGIVESLLF